MLCTSCERGTRPVPCSPLGRTGTSGWKWQGSEFGYHVGVYSSLGYLWALGPAACETSLWKWVIRGRRRGAMRQLPVLSGGVGWGWFYTPCSAEPGVCSPLQGLLWGWRGNHPAGVLCPSHLTTIAVPFLFYTVGFPKWFILEEGQETRSTDAKNFFLIFKLGAH